MYFRKLLIVTLVFLFIYGCEEIPNDIIEIKTVDYTIENISAPNLFVFSQINPTLSTSITISNTESVNNIWFDLNTGDGLETISSSNIMVAVEEEKFGETKTYIGSVILDETLLSGFYEIVYYVEDNIRTSDENVRKVGSKIFEFQSEAENIAPAISNLIIPAEINRGEQFSFSLLANDPNGLSDVDSVYYELTDPNGILLTNSQGISKFPMFDNGLVNENGDLTAGDGTYSVFLEFPNSVSTGNWSFQFRANDKSGALSNSLNHTLNVK